MGQPPCQAKQLLSTLCPPLFVCVAIQNIAQASSQVQPLNPPPTLPPLQQQTWIDTPSILTLQASERMHEHKREQRANSFDSFSSDTSEATTHNYPLPSPHSQGVHRRSRLSLISPRLISWLITAWSPWRFTPQNLNLGCKQQDKRKRKETEKGGKIPLCGFF